MCILGITSSFFLTTTASAVRFDPDATDVVIDPGTELVRTLHLINENNQTETYNLSLQLVEFGSSADDLVFSELPEDMKDWFELTTQRVELTPHSTRAIDLSISPEGEASGRVVTVALIAQQENKSAEVTGGVSVRQGVAALFFMTIGDVLEADLTISSFEATPKFTSTFPIRFITVLTNQGQATTQPVGQVVLTNMWGKDIAALPLIEIPRRIPGGTSRVFTINWQPNSGIYIGPYTATLELLSADGQSVIFKTTNVVLFPWRILALVGGLIVVILLFVWRQFRRV